MKRFIYIILVVLTLLSALVTSCNFFKKQDTTNAIARVYDSYLFKDDIKDLITDGTSKEDSTLIVNNFINNWATQQLLMAGAEINIPYNKQEEFDKLVNQYKKDLYTKAYLEGLVKKNLDETVSDQEAKEFYEQNSETFRLNEELIKFRYIKIDENRMDFSEIKKKFKEFNTEDKAHLDSISIQFSAYSLNDSIWIKLNQAVDKIPVITPENKDQLLKKSNFVQLKDSLGVYLMQINDVLLRNETAPLEYVRPTINQIVINKRKLELISDLKKDITTDAIKNKQFEIFN